MGYYRVELKKRIAQKRELAARIVEFIRTEMKHVNLAALNREIEISNLQPIIKGDRAFPHRHADRVASYLHEHYGFPAEKQDAADTKLKIEISGDGQTVKISGTGFEYQRIGLRAAIRSTANKEFSDTERQQKLQKLAVIDKFATQL